MKFNVALIF